MSASFRPLFAAAAMTAALTACDATTTTEASLQVVVDTLAVYGINDAPVGAPTALSLVSTSGVPANGGFTFDLAFDVMGDGSVRLIPNSRLASGLASTFRVGVQRIAGGYALLERAPLSGYKYDTVFVARPGDAFVVESANPSACPVAYYGTAIYGKLVIDSTRTNPSRVFLRTTIDQNCGYRSLVPGTPKD